MGNQANRKITNQIKNGEAIQEEWTNATIVYMCKNKGDAIGCVYYKAICIKQITYEI